LHFGEYLKSCRLGLNLTQEQLVQNLFIYDNENFKNLETSTISKWEKGTPQPSTSRKLSMLKFFQEKTNMALPFFSNYSVDEIKNMMSKDSMINFLGSSKQVVLNFPTHSAIDISSIRKVSEIKNMDNILKISLDVKNELYYDKCKLTVEHLEEWIKFPENVFIVCKQYEQFYGLLFTLRLKPEIFEKLVNFEMQEAEISSEHFASINEPASNYFISFIALNKEVASLLFITYYSRLIKNQKSIISVGGTTMVDDAKKLIENMCISPYKEKQIEIKDNKTIKNISFKTSLKEFIACEGVIKMLFPKENG